MDFAVLFKGMRQIGRLWQHARARCWGPILFRLSTGLLCDINWIKRNSFLLSMRDFCDACQWNTLKMNAYHWSDFTIVSETPVPPLEYIRYLEKNMDTNTCSTNIFIWSFKIRQGVFYINKEYYHMHYAKICIGHTSTL